MADEYEIRYSLQAADDVRGLRAYDRKKVLDSIEQHLRHQPGRVSHSRIKRMVQPFWSQFRLRMDPFRVYYDIDEAARAVSILRVLEKRTGATPTQELP